eukprot:5515876-Amphidinium_carterae.1
MEALSHAGTTRAIRSAPNDETVTVWKGAQCSPQALIDWCEMTWTWHLPRPLPAYPTPITSDDPFKTTGSRIRSRQKPRNGF